MKLKLTSWNINGLRASLKKELLQKLDLLKSDIICLQEIKVDDNSILPILQKEARFNIKNPQNLDEQFIPDSQYSQLETTKNKVQTYDFYWHSCTQKKGYSGVATLFDSESVLNKIIFKNSQKDLGIKKFDEEGRVLLSQFEIPQNSQNKLTKDLKISLINGYFPQGGRGQYRIDYKLEFYYAIFNLAQKLRSDGQKVIITGDLNTTIRSIDLARPNQNQKTTGCLPEERTALSWLIDKTLFKTNFEDLEKNIYQASPQIYNDLLTKIKNKSLNLVDTFRFFYPDLENKYTYWDQITRARERNVGWRIDYFLIDKDLLKFLQKAEINDQIMGSDHCPINIYLEF
jgi:exodeoxyribonuclease III